MNSLTNWLLAIDLAIMAITSLYNFIPMRQMDKFLKKKPDCIEKYKDLIFLVLLVTGILSIYNGNLYRTTFLVLLGIIFFILYLSIFYYLEKKQLILFSTDVKRCFICTLLYALMLFFFASEWKTNNKMPDQILSALIFLNFAILLLSCLRLIWNGMISIEKMNRHKNNFQIIFINSMGIIGVVVLVLSVMVYGLSVMDIFSYQINGQEGSMTFIDAMYYTMTTITTVGYGDIIPLKEGSRLLSIIVQIMGLLIISGFAVNVISYLTEENKK